jgi:LacI family transcriptional regulator
MYMRNPHRDKKPSLKGRGSNPRTLIAVALPQLGESEMTLVQSVRDFLAERKEYELIVLSGGYEPVLRELAERGVLAGTIAEFMGNRWVEFLLEHNVKVVSLGESMGSKVPAITYDYCGMGTKAARVFLSSGIKSLAYIGPNGPPGSFRLGETFVASCSESSHNVVKCPSFTGNLLNDFIRSLDKPAGLLCATDHLAQRVLLAASSLGLAIPRDLAVIGVGNSRIASLYAGMAISSFELPMAEMGRQAGLALANLLEDGSKATSPCVEIAALLHERESSMRYFSGVDRALAYMRSHPESPVSSGELAGIAGMSRRAFEIAMRTSTGGSPGTYLQTMRREHAKKMLRESSLEIGLIGRSCGYPEPSLFSAAFRRWTDMSPREYRQKSITGAKVGSSSIKR